MKVVAEFPTLGAGRAAEDQGIRDAWVAGHPVLNVRGVWRSKWRGVDQHDRDVQLTRWIVSRTNLLRVADLWARLDGQPAMFTHVPLDFAAEQNFLLGTLKWWPDSLFDRMYRRLVAERSADWGRTDGVDDAGLAYPPAVYLAGRARGVRSDERMMTGADYAWSVAFFRTMARQAWGEAALFSNRAYMAGVDPFEVPDLDEIGPPPADAIPQTPDPRFLVLEHLRRPIVDDSPVLVQGDDGQFVEVTSVEQVMDLASYARPPS